MAIGSLHSTLAAEAIDDDLLHALVSHQWGADADDEILRNLCSESWLPREDDFSLQLMIQVVEEGWRRTFPVKVLPTESLHGLCEKSLLPISPFTYCVIACKNRTWNTWQHRSFTISCLEVVSGDTVVIKPCQDAFIGLPEGALKDGAIGFFEIQVHLVGPRTNKAVNLGVPPYESLLQVCQRCMPCESADMHYLVSCENKTWSTKDHGQAFLWRLGVLPGDRLTIEVDWLQSSGSTTGSGNSSSCKSGVRHAYLHEPVSSKPLDQAVHMLLRIADTMARTHVTPKQLFERLSANAALTKSQLNALLLEFDPILDSPTQDVLFDIFDRDNSGDISLAEFCRVFEHSSACEYSDGIAKQVIQERLQADKNTLADRPAQTEGQRKTATVEASATIEATLPSGSAPPSSAARKGHFSSQDATSGRADYQALFRDGLQRLFTKEGDHSKAVRRVARTCEACAWQSSLARSLRGHSMDSRATSLSSPELPSSPSLRHHTGCGSDYDVATTEPRPRAPAFGIGQVNLQLSTPLTTESQDFWNRIGGLQKPSKAPKSSIHRQLPEGTGILTLLERIRLIRSRLPMSMNGSCPDCFQVGAKPEAMDQVEAALGVRMLPELKELYAFSDGQNPIAAADVLMVPQNLHLRFISLRRAHELVLQWRRESQNPIRGKQWIEAGYKSHWFPIGFNESKQIALCVSTETGVVIQFTVPSGQLAHAIGACKRLNENLVDYFQDLDAYLVGVRRDIAKNVFPDDQAPSQVEAAKCLLPISADSEPKRPPSSAYLLFFMDRKPQLSPSTLPSAVPEILTAEWNNLDADVKGMYQKLHEKLQGDYRQKLSVYCNS